VEEKEELEELYRWRDKRKK